MKRFVHVDELKGFVSGSYEIMKLYNETHSVWLVSVPAVCHVSVIVSVFHS